MIPNLENFIFLSSGKLSWPSSSTSLYLYFFLSIKTGKWINSPMSSGTFFTVAQFWMMTLPNKGLSFSGRFDKDLEV